MIIDNINQLTAESRVWACMYQRPTNHQITHRQPPIEGIVAYAKNEELHNSMKRRNGLSPRYFIPFKKGTQEPDWSKGVKINNRKYATTEEDCWRIYNQDIAETINHHTEQIEHLRKEKNLHIPLNRQTILTKIQITGNPPKSEYTILEPTEYQTLNRTANQEMTKLKTKYPDKIKLERNEPCIKLLQIKQNKHVDTYIWTLTPMQTNQIMVHTPHGIIGAQIEADPEYPGISLLYKEPGTGEPGAIMEYNPVRKQIQMRTYSRQHPDDEPDTIYEITEQEEPDICPSKN